ncbi:VOC family protein [Yinghuangia seranimata]|uniref:VOC family protein n=1 Tax=Yinghuangia seranimata TaxID=408067 RepID=UPI00248D3360|nr:VOC family protein [Yinghuangia seranimata]MDI2130085.1 VOC family protein [Yinghuangia seranimata]
MPRRTAYAAGHPCWIDRVGPDLTSASAFYGAVFGWSFADEDGPGGGRGAYRIASVRGEIVAGLGQAPPALPAAWHVYLAVKDPDATASRVASLGGRVVMGPMTVGDNGRLLLAVDPAGAAVGFWSGARAEGVVLGDEPGAVSGFALRVGSADDVESFYGGLFGYREISDPVLMLDGLMLDGLTLATVQRTGRLGGARWIPYIGVEDLTATASRALEAGGGLVEVPQMLGDLASMVVRDPEGALLGIVELSL